MTIVEHSVVTLRRTLCVPVCEVRVLPAGARGVVVHAYNDGTAYEVEFAEPFPCVVTLQRREVKP